MTIRWRSHSRPSGRHVTDVVHLAHNRVLRIGNASPPFRYPLHVVGDNQRGLFRVARHPIGRDLLFSRLESNQVCAALVWSAVTGKTTSSAPTASSSSVPTMTKALKCGYLLRYKRRLFSRYWKEEFIVLYEDSSMAWFKDKTRSDPEGGLVLKEAPELMAMGEYTLRIPHQRPSSLPQGCTVRQVMAFGTPDRQKVHWFVAKSEDEINDWMTAISNTLPIPPGLSVYGEAEETTSNIYESIDLQPAAGAVKVSEKQQPQQLQQQQQQQQHGGADQPCCLCAASGHGCGGATALVTPGAVTPANGVIKKSDSKLNGPLGEIATGMMLATGFAHWGWGYGLGWNKPDKVILGGYFGGGYDDLYGYGRDGVDGRYLTQYGGWSGSHSYEPDYDDCHDHDFDMDFGGDFGF